MDKNISWTGGRAPTSRTSRTGSGGRALHVRRPKSFRKAYQIPLQQYKKIGKTRRWTSG